MTEQTKSERYPCWDVFPDETKVLHAIFRGQTLETSGLPVNAAYRRCWESVAADVASTPPGHWIDIPVD